MTLREIAAKLDLEARSGNEVLDREVTGGYVSDLLSDVLAHTKKGNVWVTLQTHLNIVAVASMKQLAGIIIVNGRQPDEATLKKAGEEGVPILGTERTAFQLVGKLYQLGIRGNDEDVQG